MAEVGSCGGQIILSLMTFLSDSKKKGGPFNDAARQREQEVGTMRVPGVLEDS